MQGLKILIITHYFPPINKVAASRPFRWAKYWQEMGHDVRIITTKKIDKDGETNYFPDGLERLKVEEIDYFPNNKLKGRKTARSKERSCRPERQKELNEFLNLLTKIRAAILPIPIHKVFWTFPALKRIQLLRARWEFDVIISLFSPLSSHIIASYIKKRYKAYWVADYRDLLIGNHYKEYTWPLSSLIKTMELYFLRPADLVTTVSEPLKDKLKTYFKKPVAVIENGFDIENEEANNDDSVLNQNVKNIVYTGSIYPYQQDPSPLFSALRTLKNMRIDGKINIMITFFVNEKRIKYIEQTAIRYRVENLINIKGFVARALSLKIQKDAAALVFFDWNDSRENGIATGKIYEYISSGTPIISIGGYENSIANRIIRNTQTGICLGNDVKNITRVLKHIENGTGISISPNKLEVDRYHAKNIAARFALEIHRRKAFPHPA